MRLLSILFLLLLGVSADLGTATFYGGNDDRQFSLKDGTCACWKSRAYGTPCYNDWCFEDVWWPYAVAAVNTPGVENTRECGQCYRLTCVPGRVRGRQDSKYGPWNGCLFPNASVTVKVTDSCPCQHWNPNNRDHCCGPHKHFDLSHWAFGKVGLHEQGVIDVAYEKVDCPSDWDLGLRSGTDCGKRGRRLSAPRSTGSSGRRAGA